MAVYPGAESIYAAAVTWRDTCLIGDGSIFSAENLWTLERFEELRMLYVEHPDASNRDFMTKLEDQLRPGSPESKRLAAELLWAILLFPSSQKPATKLVKMRRVWGWSGLDFPERAAGLGDDTLKGIGSTGPAFQNLFWMEFAYAVELLLAIKRESESERRVLLSDPKGFADFADRADRTHARQLYHVLIHLLFPDRFERIASRKHKGFILARFGNDEEKSQAQDRMAIDAALFSIRARLSAEHGIDFDYYSDRELRGQWLPDIGSGDPEVGELDHSAGGSTAALPESYRGARFWVLGTGENGRLWPDFRDKGYVGVSFTEFAEPLDALSYEEIYSRLLAGRSDGSKPTMDARAGDQFAREMHVGDYVFAKQGRSSLLGFGRVSSDYRYEEREPYYRHRRSVEWIKTGTWTLAEDQRITPKTLTYFTNYPEWIAYALTLIGEGGGSTSAIEVAERPEESYGPALRPYGIDDLLAEGVFLDRGELEAARRAWEDKKNLILAGPPGTGKSWLAQRLAWARLGAKDASRLLKIQFHQSYSYEDFVRGYRPGEGKFELRDGPFLEFCARARKDPERRPYVLLIDEINRGDISRVFGELFFLLEADKRTPEYALGLSCPREGDEPFFIPPNLYLIGTMNSADRSLAVVDYALRRRFAFVNLRPAFDREAFSEFMTGERVGASDALVARIIDAMKRLNQEIASDRNLGQGYAIGHSYFTSVGEDTEVDEAWYRSVIETQILPTLEEYWFDQSAKVHAWREQLIR
jgi:MoxR-like ATPase